MKERPILFSAPMVCVLLAGTKTQRRRIVKPQPECVKGATWVERDGLLHPCRDELCRGALDAIGPGIKCPYGVPGDRLWVREAFKFARHSCADDGSDESEHECGEFCEQTLVYYSATPREGMRAVPDRARMRYFAESTPLPEWYTKGWKPSIHMPRWASRITLEITATRVERVQSISEADAKAEGVGNVTGPPLNRTLPWFGRDDWWGPVHAFHDRWDQINGADPAKAWAANPWVWVVEFRRVSP